MKNSALARWVLDEMSVVWPRLSEKSARPTAEKIASRWAYSEESEIERNMGFDLADGMTLRDFNRKYKLGIEEAILAEADPVFACGETSR